MKRILSTLTALALTIALSAVLASAAGAGRTVLVSDSNTFNNAIADLQDGDTIRLTGSFVVTPPTSSNDSLFIDKNVTIDGQGYWLSLRYAGVLLGADVTFKDVSLGLASNVRPALIANGHTLTLDGVTRDPANRNINLFCGGQTGRTQGDLSASSQGDHGQIIIRGNTYLGPTGRIFAGSISTDGTNNEFTKPATVTIEPSVKGDSIGEIYACGAVETHTDENDWFDYEHEIDPPFASPGNFQVSGRVTFNLYQGKVRKVSGDTGVRGNLAQVNYNGTDYLNDSLLLSNIGGLTVESGNLAPVSGRLELDLANRLASLVEAPDSSFFGNDAPLAISSGASLGLQNLGAKVTVGNFTGGGALVLGRSQKLTVTGTVTETTTVGVGSIFNHHSQTVPNTEDHTYIDAARSAGNSFTLAAPASRPDLRLVRDSNGAWTAEADETIIIVNDFKLASAVVEADAVELPSLAFQDINATVASPATVFAYIDLTISINEADTTIVDDGCNGSVYSTDSLWLSVADDGYGTGEVLEVSGENYSQLPAGTYVISVTVPAGNSGTGQPITRTATLTVKDPGGGATVIPEPTANTGLVYNGQVQTGVPLNDAYELVSGKASATEAGDYTATVTPATGFTWADSSATAIDIAWTIAKADNLNLPTGLGVTAPTTYGGSDGKITGTTAEMEYSADGSFLSPADCTATETSGLTAGDYYVRYKGDNNHDPGEAVLVTVLQGPLTVQSAAISSTGHKTAYKVGEPLDVTGLTLTVTMSDNSAYTVPVAAGMVSGFNSSAASPGQSLTITYGGKTVTYTISIAEDADAGHGGGSPSDSGLSSGGESSSDGSSGSGSDSSNTTTNADGSVTTTVTNQNTGTVTTTTQKTDGSTTVVEVQKDGTVTITDIAQNGVKVEAVSRPEADTSAQVTIPADVKTATVTVPVAVTPGMVAVDARTGEIVKLSAPTEDGMVVKLEASADLVLVDRSKSFTDTDGHWAKNAIDFTTAHALFNGTSNTTFAPDESMTRGMVAVVLYNFEGKPDSAVQNDFTDVASGMWYTDAIHWIAEKGITGGYGNGSFGTDDYVTREQLVTFLYRYAGSMGYGTEGDADLSAFSDGASVNPYATEAMRWAVGNGLIAGTGRGVLAPESSATRAQVASILNRFVLNLIE